MNIVGLSINFLVHLPSGPLAWVAHLVKLLVYIRYQKVLVYIIYQKVLMYNRYQKVLVYIRYQKVFILIENNK